MLAKEKTGPTRLFPNCRRGASLDAFRRLTVVAVG